MREHESIGEATTKRLPSFGAARSSSPPRSKRRWREKAVKIVERYETQKKSDGARLNVFHANVEALNPRHSTC